MAVLTGCSSGLDKWPESVFARACSMLQNLLNLWIACQCLACLPCAPAPCQVLAGLKP